MAERSRLQNIDIWQREGDWSTFICGREEATELRHVAERMKPQNLDVWQRE